MKDTRLIRLILSDLASGKCVHEYVSLIVPKDTTRLRDLVVQRSVSPERAFESITDQDFLKMVYNAIKAGYRLFDGAGDYGNEKEAGEGVRRALKEGIVKRGELCAHWLCSSIVNPSFSLTRNSSSHHFQGRSSVEMDMRSADWCQLKAVEHIPCPGACASW
jgi:hypothetical protein